MRKNKLLKRGLTQKWVGGIIAAVMLTAFTLPEQSTLELERFKENDKYSFRDQSTHGIVVTAKYNWVENFSEGRAWVQLNGKPGYVDKQGNESWD